MGYCMHVLVLYECHINCIHLKSSTYLKKRIEWYLACITLFKLSWWRHQKEKFSALLAICAGNSPVSGEFPSQRPVTRSFDVFFDSLCLVSYMFPISGVGNSCNRIVFNSVSTQNKMSLLTPLCNTISTLNTITHHKNVKYQWIATVDVLMKTLFSKMKFTYSNDNPNCDRYFN